MGNEAWSRDCHGRIFDSGASMYTICCACYENTQAGPDTEYLGGFFQQPSSGCAGTMSCKNELLLYDNGSLKQGETIEECETKRFARRRREGNLGSCRRRDGVSSTGKYMCCG